MSTQDIPRFKKTPATGADAGNTAITDSNIKAIDRIAIPVNETNTFNGGKEENGVINLSRNADGDLVFQSYADGKWTEYVAVLDGLKSVGGITLDGNDVTVVAPVKWRINSVNYEKLTNTVITVNSATDGFKRIDYIYADTNGDILLIEGTEVEDGNPYIPPTLPANTVMVAPVYISGDTVLQPIPDLTMYLTKSEADALYSVISPSGAYIQASPSIPQDDTIRISQNVFANQVFVTGVTSDGGLTLTAEGNIFFNMNQSESIILGNENVGGVTAIELWGIKNYIGITPETATDDFDFMTRAQDDGELQKVPIDGMPKLSGSSLFTITDPKDYVQAGYVDDGFVDLTNNQSVEGIKEFLDGASVGGVFNDRPNVGDPAHVMNVVNDAGDNLSYLFQATAYANSTGLANFHIRKARGTYASPLAILSGDVLASFGFRGYDGTNFAASSVAIQATAEENFDPTHNGTSILFQTTPLGNHTGNRVNALKLNADGGAQLYNYLLSVPTLKPAIILNSSGANYGHISNIAANEWALGFGSTLDTLGSSVLSWNGTGQVKVVNLSGTGTRPVAAAADGTLVISDLGTGWAVYSDTVYTIGSPFVINSGVTSTVPNNAGTVLNSQLPTGITSFYDSSTNKITPQNNGDYYLSTIRFKATTTAPTGGYLDFGIDIGGALGVQFKETKIFAKGAGIEHQFSIVVPFYSAATFIANGGLVKITAGSGNISMYEIQFQIDRVHKAK